MLYIGVSILAGIAVLALYFSRGRERQGCPFGIPGCDGTRCYQCRRAAGE